jgi:hypothetical protein
LEDVVPAHGETPGWINEASRVSVETTRDGVHDSEFTQSVDCSELARDTGVDGWMMALTDVEDHDSHDGEVEEKRGRALGSKSARVSFEVSRLLETYTLGEGSTGTDEETSTNGATDGNHVQVARLHGPVKLDHGTGLGAALERLEVQTVARPEVLGVAPLAAMALDLRVDGGVGVGSSDLLIVRDDLLVVGDGLLVVHDGRSARE